MSSRKRRHVREEHSNHEAWVIPYADLLTLLLALFVVLYAISSVNDGKYRVLSNALFAEFRGAPRAMEPIQVGDGEPGDAEDSAAARDASMINGHPPSMIAPISNHPKTKVRDGQPQPTLAEEPTDAQRTLMNIADDVTRAMSDLIRANVVTVRRHANFIEVELRTDILYPSASATLSPDAVGVIQRLSLPLQHFPNPIRVEGHTDDRPINKPGFPSNWELSSARAATVVHLLASSGVDPARLSVMGRAEYSPIQPNTTPEGRNANRRVTLVILSTDGSVPSSSETGTGTGSPASPNSPAQATPAQPGTIPSGTPATTVAAPGTTAALTPSRGTFPAP